MKQKMIVLATGGTIAGLKNSPQQEGYRSAQMSAQALMDSVPGLKELLGDIELHTEQIAQIDSKDMDFATMLHLARCCSDHLSKPDVKAVLITHGTDTLEETAYFLQQVIPLELQKNPIVMTCAMRPANASDADGPGNIRDAICVCVSEGSMPEHPAQGVLIVCAGQVHASAYVQKIHSQALAAFSSGDEALGEPGVMGYVMNKNLIWTRSWQGFLDTKSSITSIERAGAASFLIADKNLVIHRWPRVEIVLNHSHASGRIVRALLADSAADEPLDGIVVAGTGNGTLSEDLLAGLRHAHEQGVSVLRASRCAQGGAVAWPGDEFPATQLSAVKARVQMVLDKLLAGLRA